LNPADVALTLLADKVNAEATQAVVNMHFTATGQVLNATATQQQAYLQATGTQQARIDADATSAQVRRDVQATQSRIDADATQAQARVDAQSTADQARLDLQATQQASGTQTAFSITQTAIPPAATLTQIANGQNIIIANNQVELSNLAVQQQTQKNTPEWLIPYSLVVLAAIGGLLYLYSQSRVREIKNGDDEVELLILDGKRAIRPKLLSGPVLDLDDVVTMPMLTSPIEQAKVTERAQAVEAIKSMPVSTTPQAAQTFNKYFGSQREDLPFDVIDAEDAPPAGLLDGETLKSLNKDWKEAQDGG
jgi:multidrug efflux pump subunit AcrA (membrane-fusion protein)